MPQNLPIIPLGNKVIIRPLDPPTSTKSGLILLYAVHKDFEKGTIVDVSADVKDMPVAPGQVVTYPTGAGSVMEDFGYKVLNADDILLIHNDGP